MSKSHAFPLAKYLLLSSAMVSLYPVPSAAIAQEAATEEAPVEIVVVGTRASTASAINRKKRAGTVSDSIVADDIGQFPDKNVGEALSRITGVQLSRDFGEGVSVSIRGVEPNLNRVEINGLNVLGTSGGGTAGGERGADFRELPSEIIQSVDVFKGFTADMTEGGIGGTVSIKTRKPLDFRKPTVSGTLSYQKLSLLDGYTPRASLLVADKFLDDRLGVLLNVTYDKVNTRQDYTGNTEWVRLADFDQSLEKTVVSRDPQWAAAETWAECNGNATCLQQWWDYSPRTARYRVWDRQDKRLSADLTVQYQLNDRLNVWGSYNLNKRSQRLNDRNYGTAFTAVNRLKTGSITSGNAASVPAGIVVDENHNVINYTVRSRLDVTVGLGQGVLGVGL
ncbi:MAG: TonB-dependent receptor plug domain-containing protein, partial [Asticcacaulis sp.]